MVPYKQNRSHQNLLRNKLSWFETIDWGIPWRWQISFVKWEAVNFVGSPPKWPYLVKRSTITHIIVCPLELGKWVIKSMLISDQAWWGVGNDCYKPKILEGTYLLCWKITQDQAKVFTCVAIPSQKIITLGNEGFRTWMFSNGGRLEFSDYPKIIIPKTLLLTLDLIRICLNMLGIPVC